MVRISFDADDRGAVWSIEALLFLVVILVAVTIAAQSIPDTTSAEEFETLQRQQLADDVLQTADATGAMNETVRYWNAKDQRWVNSTGSLNDSTYTNLATQKAHPLWPAVNTTLNQRLYAYNLYISYQVDADGDGRFDEQATIPVVYQGPAGQGAVTSSHTEFVYDSDTTANASVSTDGDPCTLQEMTDSTSLGTNGCQSDAYFAPDAAPGSTRYNTLQIRLVVWTQ